MNNPINEQSLRSAFASDSGHSPTSDFDLNVDLHPQGRMLRDAAVLVPLQKLDDVWTVVLTKRSGHLKHHPGQIAFPGGKVDAIDGTPLNAALREADEEIGLNSNQVQIVGTLPRHETVTSFMVTPFVGIIPTDFTPIPEAGEVADVFNVPLSHFLKSENFQIQHRVWQGAKRKYYTVPFGPYYVWGATARMMRLFCDIYELHDAD